MNPRVVSRTPLLYTDGASSELDRPGHVRAGSALVLWRDQLAVIQDDASFLALIDRKTGLVRDVPFPVIASAAVVRQFDDTRGNKKSKLDLEAAFVFEDKLVAMGSGSSRLRERFVIIDDAVSLRDMHAFYNYIRAMFEGELNLEGAVALGDDLLLFQRGNGVRAKNQTARVPLAALLEGKRIEATDVRSWNLPGQLTFTDATKRGDEIWFLACAEASPDATRDGPVSAVALGRLGPGSSEIWPILDEHGAPLLEKTEGLAFDPEDPSRLYVVTDRDDATLPSDLLVISLA